MPASAPKLLLMFDLDGTLIDSRDDLCAAVNRMRDEYGLPPLPVETAAGFIGDGIHKLVERALRGHAADIGEAVQKCAAHYRAHLCDRTVLYPGVREGLQQLHDAGHRLALISNKPGDACRRLMAHFAIERLFSVILGGGDTPHLKPHPEPLRETMRRLSAPAGESWMIGDHRTDLEAARHAGVRSVFLAYGIGQAEPERPDLRFETFDELTRWFLGDGGVESAKRSENPRK